MPKGLRRIYGRGDFHFITCSCYHRQAFLKSARRRDVFLEILEQVRKKYRFIIAGYVVMPEHFHLLISEPEQNTPSAVMRVLKQRVARKLLPRRRSKHPSQQLLFEDEVALKFWQARFYDFNVYSRKKRVEKLRYIHRNPVKRGLVDRHEEWKWSSYRFYAEGIDGAVMVNE
jgi:REP-associated tyrosine transposase